MEDYKKEEVLAKLYWSDGLTIHQIADELGCGHATVGRWMKNHGIKSRRDFTPPKEDLRYDYAERGSYSKVGKKYHVTAGQVGKWFNEYGLKSQKPNHEKPPSFYTNTRGYELCRTQVDEEVKSVRIHRLVAACDSPNLEGKHVHHKNEIPWDNRPSNLEVMEPGEHTAHHNLKNEA